MKVEIRRVNKSVYNILGWRYAVYRITRGGTEIFEDFTITLAGARRVARDIIAPRENEETIESYEY